MPTRISAILRAAGREAGDPLNILTFATHERYEVGLATTGHDFWSLHRPGMKAWDPRFAPVPVNYHVCAGGLPPDVAIDLVLTHERYSQFDTGADFARAYQVPHVALEHVLPHPRLGQGDLSSMRAKRADLNVFISDFSREAWGFAGDDVAVVEHGIDTELFSPIPGAHRQPHALSVVNQWESRDAECGYRYWLEATEGLPVRVLGDNPGLSEPAHSTAHLAFEYATSGVFVNTALVSPVPTVLLEAMSAGCAVVSTRNPMIESVIHSGVNGLLVDGPAEMRGRVAMLLEDAHFRDYLGDEARRTILQRFSLPRFANDWNALLEWMT